MHKKNSTKKKSNKSNFLKKAVFSNISKGGILVKLLIIVLILFTYHWYNYSFTNTINLLAVTQDDSGKVVGGSVIPLTLKVTRGNGSIFVNLKNVEEVDTQISILNSQKIACDIFKLNCSNYNFYYYFDTSSVLLKGPSASSAIAILVAKTLNREKIDPNEVAITGALGIGGLIENVGGIDEKVKAAKNFNFKKVLIPEFSKENAKNLSEKYGIPVFKVLDIIDAYNNFNGKKYNIKITKLNSTVYSNDMKNLANLLCNRAHNYLYEVNNTINFTNNSFYNSSFNMAKKNLDYSKESYNSNNFYSAASFCYGADISLYQIILLNKYKNLSQNNLNILKLKLNDLSNRVNLEYVELNSDGFRRDNIKTINDFYAYLIILNRINEARIYIKNTKDDLINLSKLEKSIKNINNDYNGSLNQTNESENNSKLFIEENNYFKSAILNYAYAYERFNTIKLWKKLISHYGEEIKLSDNKASILCSQFTKDVLISQELLNSYHLNIFDNDVKKLQEISYNPGDKYLCIYNALELKGKMNALFMDFSVDMSNKSKTKIDMEKIYNFTNYRISLHSSKGFPIIPYIYQEYAKDLIRTNSFYSAMIYMSYSLAFLDLNTYFSSERKFNSYVYDALDNLFSNYLFLFLVLFILAFTE